MGQCNPISSFLRPSHPDIPGNVGSHVCEDLQVPGRLWTWWPAFTPGWVNGCFELQCAQTQPLPQKAWVISIQELTLSEDGLTQCGFWSPPSASSSCWGSYWTLLTAPHQTSCILTLSPELPGSGETEQSKTWFLPRRISSSDPSL